MTRAQPHPRILVVEDETDIARIICNALDDYGFRWDHAATGRRCLQVQPDRQSVI